jgi:uncharacterized RDD family membrane protein YckC
MTEPQSFSPNPDTGSLPSPDERWRREITARVAGYRHRKGRRIEGAFSMRFPFPPTADLAPAEASLAAVAGMEIAAEPQLAAVAEQRSEGGIVGDIERIVVDLEEREAAAQIDQEAQQDLLSGDEAMPEADPMPVAPRPRSRRKVIAFPRQITTPPSAVHRLADPIVPEQPRILDVPEELEAFPATPLLDGLHLPAISEQTAFTPPDHIELPFQAADLSRRLYAGVIDCSFVAIAAGVFAAVCWKMLPGIGRGKPVLIAGGAAVVLLWAVYQYLFLMYAGATPGMRSLNICMRTFKGGPPKWRHRRSRAVGLYLSTASLMMGLLWALVDVDALCWHDRISRTYLTNGRNGASAV